MYVVIVFVLPVHAVLDFFFLFYVLSLRFTTWHCDVTCDGVYYPFYFSVNVRCAWVPPILFMCCFTSLKYFLAYNLILKHSALTSVAMFQFFFF